MRCKLLLACSEDSRALSGVMIIRIVVLTTSFFQLTLDRSTHPSYVSNASSESSWSCTISPSGVADVIDQLDGFHALPTHDPNKLTTADAGENVYDFKGLGQDPLEWLVDAEPSMLPESSLPMFPDLSSTTTTTDNDHVMLLPDENHHHAAVDEMLEATSVVNDAVLNSIADPTVTVQSLFLLPETTDC